MAGNVPTDEKGRHGVEGSAPIYEREWEANTVHMKNPDELLDLLEREIGAIMSRCSTPFCGSKALVIVSRLERSIQAYNYGPHVPQFLNCPGCGAVYRKKAIKELRPLLRALDFELDRGRLTRNQVQRLNTLWEREE